MKDEKLEEKILKFLKTAEVQPYNAKNPSSKETTLDGDYGYVQMKKRKFKLHSGEIADCTVLYYIEIKEENRGKGISKSVVEILKQQKPVIVEDVENEKFRKYLGKVGFKVYIYRPTNIINPNRVWMIYE